MNPSFILFGLVLTSFFVEFSGILPGGLIVPVYLSLYYQEPERIIGTLGVSLIVLLMMKFLAKTFLLSKKQKFSLTIILSSLLTFFWWKWLPFLFPADFIFKTVGWIIPGLFASTLDRDGFLKTLLFTLLITTALFLFYQYGFLALQQS